MGLEKGIVRFFMRQVALLGFLFFLSQFDILNTKHLSLVDVLEVVVEASWCAE